MSQTETLGRSADEIAAERAADRAVQGVELPGDVGIFVRDDDLAGRHPTNPAVAAWRSVQEAVAVTVWPVATDADGTPACGAAYVADIRRWDPETGAYTHTDVIVGGVELARLPTVVRGALLAASDTSVHTYEQLCAYADQVCGRVGGRGWA